MLPTLTVPPPLGALEAELAVEPELSLLLLLSLSLPPHPATAIAPMAAIASATERVALRFP
jgi:hypothetical protein